MVIELSKKPEWKLALIRYTQMVIRFYTDAKIEIKNYNIPIII